MAENSSESGAVHSKPRVSVRTLNGHTYHFDVEECTTVQELKQMIQSELDFPIERQRLLFQGKILTDVQLLKEANCFNKVIHLVKRAQPPPNTPTAAPADNTNSASNPPPPASASGVVFGNIPTSLLGATQQIINGVWHSIAPNTTSGPAPPPTSGSSPVHGSVPPPTSGSSPSHGAAPHPASASGGVVFGSIPPSLIGATHQIISDMWQTIAPAPLPTSGSSPVPVPPASGSFPVHAPPLPPASGSSPNHGPTPASTSAEHNNRTATAMLCHTRQLLLHCQRVLDKFERGESISPQEVPRPPPPTRGPSVSLGASLLGDLFQQQAGVYERLQPLFREQARFLSEDRALETVEQERVERLSTCIKMLLEALYVCELNLSSLSVSCSQRPPRTVQLGERAGRGHHVFIQTPHMARVQVNVNQTNAARPTTTTSTTTTTSSTGSSFSQQPPLPPLPDDIANFVAQTLSTILPGGSAPVNSSISGAHPPTISGEAVIIQNGVVNEIPISSGAGAVPSFLQAGIPMDLTILELARILFPDLEQESADDFSAQLLLLLCGLLTVSQLREIGQGRVERLQSMYPRIREFVLTQMLSEEGHRGTEDRTRAARRLAVSAGENLDGLLDAIPIQEELDLKETLVNFLSLHLKTAIALILDPRNEEPAAGSQVENRFGKVIWGWGHNMLCELLQLLDVMSRDGNSDVHSVIEAYFQTFNTPAEIGALLPINPLITTLRDNREKIDSIVRNSRMSSDQIKDKYFIKKNQDPILPPAPTAPEWLCEEWKQCLEQDKTSIEAAAHQTNCLSNSYMSLSGLTTENDEKISCSAEDVLCETLTMSINTSQVTPDTSVEAVVRDTRQNSTLKKRYNEFIDSNLKKRLRSDPNYSTERFPNSADKFKPEEP